MAKPSQPSLFLVKERSYHSIEIRISYDEIIIDEALIIEELFLIPLKKPKLIPEVTNLSP